MSFMWGNTANQQPEPKKFANISNDQINSNQQAVPVKYLAGRQYVAGDYISPAYNPKAVPVKTKTGKSESSTTGYKYFADFALMFCVGGRQPVDGIYKVIVDSDIRWKNDTGVLRTSREHETITVEDLGKITLYWGTETQNIDRVLLTPRGVAGGSTDPNDSTTWPPADPEGNQTTHQNFPSGNANPFSGHYEKHPAYRGQCYAVFKDWKLGRDRTSVPNIQFELVRGCPWVNNGHVASTDAGVNPVAVLYDWLTDDRFGMAIDDSFLNIPSFQAAYSAVQATGLRISPLITQQTDFRSQIAELLQYFDGWIRINKTKIEVGMWARGNISSNITLTDNELLGEPELEPQGWGPTINELTVVYKDKDHHFNDYVQVYRDPNNFRITGGPRPETFQRPWITDADTAKAYARVSGAAMALPFTRGTLTVKREWMTANGLLPGMIFNYNSGFYGLSFLMRLLEVEHAADNSAKAVMTVEWERSKWPSIYTPLGYQGPGGFVLGPRAIWQSRIVEVPYLIEDKKFDTQIIPLAVRGNVEVQGYRIWLSLDNGATYQIVPDDSSTSMFSSFGKLDEQISASVQSCDCHLFGIDLDEVVTQTQAEWDDDNLLLFIDNEVMSVGAVLPLNNAGKVRVRIYRGRFGTTKAIHQQNKVMYFLYRNRMQLIDNVGFVPGAVVKFKLQPFTSDLDLDITDLDPITYTVVGFGDIPTPSLSPAPSVFYFPPGLQVRCSNPPTGGKIRRTRDGTPVTGTSGEWPKSGGQYTTSPVNSSLTLRVRFYMDDGRVSPELVAHYTKMTGTPPPQQRDQCGTPGWSFDGVLQHTSGNLTLTQTTTGSTIHYIKTHNGVRGAEITSTTTVVVAFALNDEIEFWATKADMDDSQHRTISNEREITFGGGGHWPPRNPV